MRLSELFRAERELGAGRWPAAGGRAPADDPATDSGEPAASDGLAARLARLPAGHPSALPDADWSEPVRLDTVRPGPVWSDAVWSDGQPGGDAWWRGESDIWWRVRAARDASYDDTGGPDSELADTYDGTGDPADAWRADEAEADDQPGDTGGGPTLTGRRTAGPAGQLDGHRGEPGWTGAGHGSYQPWFSPGVAGDPWFAAGPGSGAGLDHRPGLE